MEASKCCVASQLTISGFSSALYCKCYISLNGYSLPLICNVQCSCWWWQSLCRESVLEVISFYSWVAGSTLRYWIWAIAHYHVYRYLDFSLCFMQFFFDLVHLHVIHYGIGLNWRRSFHSMVSIHSNSCVNDYLSECLHESQMVHETEKRA